MKIECEVEPVLIEKPGCVRPGTSAVCGECEHYVEVPLEGEEGEKAALEKMRLTCPGREGNHYVAAS